MSRITRLFKAYQKNTNKSVVVDKIVRVQDSYAKEKEKARERKNPINPQPVLQQQVQQPAPQVQAPVSQIQQPAPP